MDDKWKIELYENDRGEKLLEKFFDSLDKKARLKIAQERLREYLLRRAKNN